MSNASEKVSKETQRIDVLLAKWGIGISGMGGQRPRRRAIALVLAQDYGEKVTDQVFQRFFSEAKLRGLKNGSQWVMSILEDEVDRRAYFPEMLKEAEEAAKSKPKPDPGDSKVLEAGSKAEYERRAALSGKTVSQEVHLAKRSYMWNRMWGDGYSIEDIAKEQGLSVQDCRYEISKECETQWDRLPNEDELRDLRKTTGLSINEQREQITRRFELKDIHWRQCISHDTSTKILKIVKDKGWPSPLRSMTLADWESMEAEKRQRSKGAKLTPEHEPRKDNRAETIDRFRDAPPPKG